MKRITRKPFHLKTKLFYQTKINLWNKQLNSFKSKKRKWVFLKKNKKQFLSESFRFIPFSTGEFNRKRSRQDFKNNLYLRKLVRFKYGRLKNYDLYRVFKKSNGYKNFIQNLGSRLDTVLCQLLYPISIYQLRQHLSHGKFLLNGRKVKSPNISLKALDVISFDLSELANLNTFFEGKKGRGRYFLDTGRYFFFHSNYTRLKNDSEKERFVDKLSKQVTTQDKYEGVLIDFFSKFLKASEEFPWWKEKIKKDLPSSVVNKSKKLSWDSFSTHVKQKIIIPEIRYNLEQKKKRFILSNIKTSSKQVQSLGFFNNNFIIDHFEISIRNNYIDCVFLGFSEEKAFINNNNKYLLHYLYK